MNEHDSLVPVINPIVEMGPPYLEQTASGLRGRIATSPELLSIIVQARIDYIRLNGIYEDEDTAKLLDDAIDVVFYLTGLDQSMLDHAKRMIQHELDMAAQAVSNDEECYPLKPDDLGSLGQEDCIQMLCGILWLAEGLEPYEHKTLLDVGIFLAEFYGAWQGDGQARPWPPRPLQ